MLPGKEKTQQYGLLDCLGQVKCHTEQVGSTAWSNVNQIHYFSFIIVSLLHEDNMTFLYHPQTAHSKQEVVSLGILMSKETVACPLEVRKEHIQTLTPPCQPASAGLLNQSSDIKKVFLRWTVLEARCLSWGSSRLGPWEGLAGASRIVPHWVNPRQANAVLPTERFQWFQKARRVDSFGSVLSFL